MTVTTLLQRALPDVRSAGALGGAASAAACKGVAYDSRAVQPGEIFVAPVLVIESAELKSVEDIVTEVGTRTAEVQKADREMLERLRGWGRLVPFAFLRRAMLRSMFASPTRRRKVAGTFQVSVVPADWALSSAFVATGVLIAGAVRARVVAFEGQCVVRPTMTLTLSADHGAWDGKAATRFLAGVRSELEAAFSVEASQ